MSNAVPQKKTFFQIANKNFIMLFVAYTVICITHSMTNSVTSAGWRLAGMDLTTIGLIASAMSWAAFIIRPFSAPITDRGNKKLIYIAAVGALTLAVFMYSLSMDNSAFAVPAKIIHGVSWTFISTITAVIVSEYVPREDLGTAMGFFMISQMIASAVSQPVAFALAEYMGYASMLLVFTAISAFGLVLVCFAAPTKVPARLPGQSMFGGLKLNNLFAKEAISPMIINVAFQGTRTGITVFMAAFALEELEARVRTLLRREFVQRDTRIQVGELILDTTAREISARGRILTLTPREFAILEHLMLSQGRWLSQEVLLDYIWETDANPFTNAIRMHISALRKKLREALGYDPIRTKVGQGYRLEMEEHP